ncbi:MAG: hypothetical protein ACI8XO_003697 [Verrucomicrobiales bacterium]|jgi:hypothetical protein
MIIVCTNTGHLRAFRVSQSEIAVEAKNQISEILDEQIADESQGVTDQAGRFASDGSPGMANGEANGIELEEERRLITRVAKRIGTLVTEGEPEKWMLAAPRTINSRLIAELGQDVSERMVGNEKSDLTKLPTLEVGRRFGVI